MDQNRALSQTSVTDTGPSSLPEKASPSSTHRSKARFWGFLILVLLLICGAGFWFYKNQTHTETQSTPLLSSVLDRMQGLEDRTSQLETALQRLESAVSSLPSGAVGDVGPLREQMARLAQQVEQLQNQRESSATGLILAVGLLKNILDAERPYVQELTALQVLAGGNKQIQPLLHSLESYAMKGIPSTFRLIQQFSDVGDAAVKADKPPEGQGWEEKGKAWFNSVVHVRPQGSHVKGGSVAARVARAEAALQVRDIAKAVQEIENIQGSAADVLAPWLADAKARLEADQVLASLTTLSIQQLAPQVKGATP